MCMSAVVSNVTQELQSLLTKDDRIAMQPAKYERALQEQLDYVNSLPQVLFSRLAAQCPGVGARKFESDCLQASYQAAGFCDRRLFDDVRTQFVELMHGDITAKLVKLQDPMTPTATDEHAWKAQTLLRVGYPLPLVREALELCRHGPWSILHYEQMHGGGAAQHKQHKR